MAANASREVRLIRLAERCEDAASGLYGLKDRLLQYATALTSIISELFGISAVLRHIHNGRSPRSYGPSFYRIEDNLALVVQSLDYTLDDVLTMFERSRTRSERTVWEDLNHRLEREEGVALLLRLEIYREILESQCQILEDAEQHSPRELSDAIASLLTRQQRAYGTDEDISPGLHGFRRTAPDRITDEDATDSSRGARTPRPRTGRTRRSRSRRRSRPPVIWPVSTVASSDEYIDFAHCDCRPLAPDPPVEMPSLSPTETHFSSGSARTRSSYTSYTSDLNLDRHWATNIFDGSMPTTAYKTNFQSMDRCRCFGEVEHNALENLADNDFNRVLEIPFDENRFWVRLYWRPLDYVARILLMTQDRNGRSLQYCAPLRSIKLIRQESCLLLCRLDGETVLRIWARLNFQLHERMVLFSCAFLAMKYQDSRELPHRLLSDLCPLEAQHGGEEQLFAGKMNHGGMRHVLRLFRDRCSGVVRLEASPRHGSHQDVPIWTAFVTRQSWDPDWVHLERGAVVSVVSIRPPPSVFMAGYEPPRNRAGIYILPFASDQGTCCT